MRIYPNQSQKTEFRSWINTTRYVYNKSLEHIRKTGNDSINFYELRNKFVTAKGNELTDWELNVPKDVRAGGIRDLTKAYKTMFSNIRQGNIKRATINFRNKRDTQSIEIPKTAIKTDETGNYEIYKTYKLGTISKCKRDKGLKIEHDCRLLLDRFNHWYLIIPFSNVESKVESNVDQKINDCSLDPGIRKFQTIFSPNETIKCTTNYNLLRKLKDRISWLATLRSSKIISKQLWSRKNKKLWYNHTNLIDDYQYQLSNYLSKNYKTIYLKE